MSDDDITPIDPDDLEEEEGDLEDGLISADKLAEEEEEEAEETDEDDDVLDLDEEDLGGDKF
jgi:hypothetical protein